VVTLSAASIRKVRLQELPQLHSLIQAVYRGASAAESWSHDGEVPTGERISVDVLTSLLDDPAFEFLVAELDGRLVGSALVERLGETECEIGLLSVALDRQGNGIGDQLLREAEKVAMLRYGSTTSTIEVLEHKPRLLAYYERRGYRPTGASRPYPHQLKLPARFLVLSKLLGC
jgi:ribosomal protein S18 acetylase RimI-like enzyme